MSTEPATSLGYTFAMGAVVSVLGAVLDMTEHEITFRVGLRDGQPRMKVSVTYQAQPGMTLQFWVYENFETLRQGGRGWAWRTIGEDVREALDFYNDKVKELKNEQSEREPGAAGGVEGA